MRWVVTGGSGFVGRHVLDALGTEHEVVALGRRCPERWARSRFWPVDLLDPPALHQALAMIQPDVVVHAAGATPPAAAPELYRVNIAGTRGLLQACEALAGAPRLVVVGSAAELGPVPADRMPIGEDCLCRPGEAYGLSKWAASRLALGWERRLPVMVARLFNPIGPGLGPFQAFGRFARILARASGPEPLRLEVGPLSARRDFVDVRDAARALLALGAQARPGLYHVGTGHSRTVRAGLEILVRHSGRVVEVVERSQPVHGPADSRALITRLVEATGWATRVTFEQSLADLWHEVATASASRRAS
jgi:GDP-4-dehydro-6-deoxy-D-mannose reductase